MKKACCDGFSCIQKDEWYGQCLPTGTPAPDGWDGKIVDYSTGELTAEEPVEDNVDELEDTGAPMPASDPDEDTVEDEDDGVAPMQTTGAAVPIAAPGDVSYMAFTAKDYLPTGSVPKMVAVEDVKPASSAGHTVLDQMECEDLCTATEKCNAASYYLDGTSYGGMNCWLKIIADSCELPADADNDPNAVLLLKIDATCPETTLALAPESDSMAPTGVALAPSKVASVAAPVETGESESPASTVASPSTSNAAIMQGTFVAMAIAGAAVGLF
jgi:hypothetical protein